MNKIITLIGILFLWLATSLNAVEIPVAFIQNKSITPCTEDLEEITCVIAFKPSYEVKKDNNNIIFKDGIHELGTINVLIKNEENPIAHLDISYKMVKNNIIFLMDSTTDKNYRNKGLNKLLRKHYIENLINKIAAISEKTIYIGSFATNPISDHILRKLGIPRIPELETELNKIFDELGIKEDQFHDLKFDKQKEIIEKSALKTAYFNWLKMKRNIFVVPWDFIYEQALKEAQNQVINREPFTLVSHLKKL